jgi:hypothetical protein
MIQFFSAGITLDPGSLIMSFDRTDVYMQYMHPDQVSTSSDEMF